MGQVLSKVRAKRTAAGGDGTLLGGPGKDNPFKAMLMQRFDFGAQETSAAPANVALSSSAPVAEATPTAPEPETVKAPLEAVDEDGVTRRRLRGGTGSQSGINIS